MSGFICNRLTEINQLQNSTKLYDLERKVRSGKNGGFSRYSLPCYLKIYVFLGNIHKKKLSLEHAGK